MKKFYNWGPGIPRVYKNTTEVPSRSSFLQCDETSAEKHVKSFLLNVCMSSGT